MHKNAICIVCFKPHIAWFDFLSKFIHYDIYIVIDDNSKDYKSEFSNYSNINVIQIKNADCLKEGFRNMCINTIPKEITAWEKAIYYFSSINTTYNKIWFIEDDVFFYNEESLHSIDSKYEMSDLLSNEYFENTPSQQINWIHWRYIHINFPPPYYNAMACCIRMTQPLLSKIKDYANTHNTLFFLEALFPTMCKTHNLQYDTPDEFKNILWRQTYHDKDIDKNNLYHPVKDITKHVYYRNMLDMSTHAKQ